MGFSFRNVPALSRPTGRRPIRTRQAQTLLVVGLMAALAACSSSHAATKHPASSTGTTHTAQSPLKIGLFAQVDVPVVAQAFDAFKATFLKEAGLKQSDVVWTEENAQGNPQEIQTIARDLAGRHLDGVAVIGTPCIIAMAQVDKQIPIFAVAMTDPVGAKVADSLDHPGGNVTGSSRGTDGDAVLTQILRATPKVKTLGVVYDLANPAVVAWVKSLNDAAKGLNIKVVASGVNAANQIGSAVRNVVPQVDLMVLPPDGTLATAVPLIASVSLQQHVPVFSSGVGVVNQLGVVADIGPSFADLGSLAGDAAKRVLVDGESPGAVPFALPKKENWTINLESAKALKIEIPQDVLSDPTTTIAVK